MECGSDEVGSLLSELRPAVMAGISARATVPADTAHLAAALALLCTLCEASTTLAAELKSDGAPKALAAHILKGGWLTP
jgi:hypothetical protein